MKPRSLRNVCGLLAWMGLGVCAANATTIDFVIARDADGKLVVSRPAAVTEPYQLPADADDRLNGHHLSIEPGWDGQGEDAAAEGRFALADGAQIVLRRVRFDAGFSMYNLDLDPILAADGDEELLEGEPEVASVAWHEHLVFGAGPQEPVDKQFSATFIVRDLSGQHADSDEFTVTFVTAPKAAPPPGLCGTLGLAVMPALGIGLFFARRR